MERAEREGERGEIHREREVTTKDLWETETIPFFFVVYVVCVCVWGGGGGEGFDETIW